MFGSVKADSVSHSVIIDRENSTENVQQSLR